MKLRITLLLVLIANVLLGQNYHDTQGKLEISNSGQATYTLPIALPPSIQSVGPTINLVYASGQQGGIAGQGWNISGVSSITRMATRKDIERFIDGVDKDADDKLAIDGQRLLLRSDSPVGYLVPGSTYETEIQSNLKIEMLSTSTATSYEFVVTSPDGSKSWYSGITGCDLCCYSCASTAPKHLNMTFYIYKYEDVNGNRIEYKYAPDGYYDKPSPQYIKEIYFSYNVNSNQSYTNKILFKHKPASRQEKTYLFDQQWDRKSVLDYVEVYTNMPNDLLFKKYQLTYITDELGYDRLQKIQESNGAGELANPVEFEYNLTSTSFNIDHSYLNLSNTAAYLSFDDLICSGDFNGDLITDYIFPQNFLSPKYAFTSTAQVFTTLPFTASKKRTFPISTLLSSKLNQKQSLLNINDSNATNLMLNVYDVTGTSAPVISTTKTLAFNNPIPIYDSNLNTTVTQTQSEVGTNVSCPLPSPTANTFSEYLEGDFNGDGVSEILIYRKSYEKYYYKTTNKFYTRPFGQGQVEIVRYSVCEIKYSNEINECFVVDMNPSSSVTLGTQGYVALLNSSLLQGDKKIVTDFNGDGKADVFVINNDKTYKIIGFKQLPSAPWVTLEILYQGSLSSYNNGYSGSDRLFFGDFNGDGKKDIIIPNAENAGHWNVYYNRGSFFDSPQLKYITTYLPYAQGDYNIDVNSYIVMDINKDGKDDIVDVKSYSHPPQPFWQPNYWVTEAKFFVYTFNTATSEFDNLYTSDFFEHDAKYPVYALSGKETIGKLNRDLIVAGYSFGSGNPVPYHIYMINLNKNYNSDNNLKKVTQSGGAIVDEIEYKEMEPTTFTTTGTGSPSDFYSSSNSMTYPYVEIKRLPESKLVSKLKNTATGVVRYQDFKYRGLVVHSGGLGVIGFKQTARSSWYRTDSDKKIWSVTETDPLNRGAIMKSYSQLLAGNIAFSFSNMLLVPANYPGLISKVENTYVLSTVNPSSTAYKLFCTSKTTTDFLTNVSNQTVYGFTIDGYFLPETITSRNYLSSVLQGTTTTKNTYGNSVCATCTGSSYYIGRPINTFTNINAYGNQYSTSETLSYTNGNVTRKEKKVGTTAASLNSSVQTLVEIMDYFPNGNLKSKTISATGFPVTTPPLSNRTVSYTYDPSNRYVKTTTDVDGLVTTNDVYDDRYGLVKQVTKNTFGQSTNMFYDNWGKQIKVTDYLGKSINYTYARTGNVYTSSSFGDDGSRSYVETDALGRVTRKINKNLGAGSQWSYIDTEYDWLGRKYRESEPYFMYEQTPLWNYFVYDDYSRLITNTLYTGKIVNVGYLGLTATTNDGVMEKTTTKNANGHLITSTENFNGSIQTITYTYNAAGNLIKTLTGGNETVMTYDLWGRKTSLQDKACHDSAYTYTYNAYGEVLKETTPKGFTDYTYTPTGKILTKWIKDATTPLNTNIKSTYTYDTTYKWLTKIDVVNPFDGNSTFQYFYDITSPVPTMQLKKTIETNSLANGTNAVFTTELYFDSFGRTLNEVLTATAHGKTATKTITHEYRAGELLKLFDGATTTTTPLWQLNSENQRGDLVSATLGNGLNIYNTYDLYGFPTQRNYGNNVSLNTTFDRLRGNLINRQSNLFNTNENFEYDNYDRLISWDGTSTNLLTLPFNTTTEGFTFNGTSTTGSVINYSGQLKVNLKNTFVHAQKVLALNLTSGDKLKIRADVSNKTGSGDVIVDVMMIETDPNDASNFSEIYIGNIENGLFDVNYIVSGFVQNPQLTLKFIINENSTWPSNGGGSYEPFTTFYLDNIKFDKIEVITQNYDVQGKITENNVGKYVYFATRPYRNQKINYLTPEASTYYTNRNQNVTYNAFNAPVKITQNTAIEEIDFGYNMMQQRNVMYYGSANTNKLLRPYRRYYDASGRMEIKATYTAPNSTTPSAVEFLFYIGGDAYSAPIVTKQIDSGTPTNYYLYRDYQGSIVAISNAAGALVEKRMFDPWGEVIKVQNGAGTTLTKLTFFDRGYTGHEHLEGVGLINMNARLYDPKLHRFLQPDQMLQDPQNSQNYNRYAYCFNNPLKYTDPTGNYGVGAAIIIGVAIAVSVYLVSSAIRGEAITFPGLLSSAVIGLISSVATFGVGSFVGTIGNFYVQSTVQAAAHGAIQGGLASIQGGKFWNGFAAGCVSSLAASAWSGGGVGSNYHGAGRYAQSTVGMIAFGTVMGGAGSALTGGNFWEGAVTGLVVAGLNHGMHMIEENQNLDAFAKEKYGSDYKTKFKINNLKWGSELPEKGIPTGSGLAKYNQSDKIIRVGDQRVAGLTLFANGENTIYFSDILMQEGNIYLEQVMGHEFIHAYHHVLFGNGSISRYTEFAAYQFDIDFARSHNDFRIDVNRIIEKQATYNVKNLPYEYHYQCIPGFK